MIGLSHEGVKKVPSVVYLLQANLISTIHITCHSGKNIRLS
jgi:hypothetical protein